MNNDYKDLIQDIILEEADAEVINEAWWDRVKARFSGGAAATGQALTNLKNKAVGGWKGLAGGVSNKSVDDDIKAAHATDGSEKEAYKTNKIASWKKSLTSKIYKIEQALIKQAQDFVSEVYDDAKKLGISEEDMGVNFGRHGGLKGSLTVAERDARGLCTKLAKIFNDEYTEHRQAEETKKKEKAEKKLAKKAAAKKTGKKDMESAQQTLASTLA